MPANLPRTDRGLLDWANNFYARISTDGAAVGLTPAQVTQYGDLRNTFDALYLQVSEKISRTQGKVASKNVAAKQLRDYTLLLVKIVESFPGLTPEQLIDLGLAPRKKPTRPPVPGKAQLDSVTMDGHDWKVRVHGGIGTRGRPANVVGISYFVHIGEEAPTDPALWSFVSNSHEMEITIPFDATLTPGTKVWATAFFRNSRDESGVAADPISAVINFGNAIASKPMTIKKAA